MDKISAVFQTALGGVRSSLRRLDTATQQIATAPVRSDEPADLADPLVDALATQRALEASAAVLRRADEMLGTLIDALA
jgi:flagellar hook-associated protein FlgK